MNQERVIDRVRKMLALADDKGATDGERDNALRMAHATIAKYNLDMAAIEKAAAKGKTSASSEPREFYRSVFFGRPWARVVAAACADLFFCEYLYVPATNGKNTAHLFIGRESNALTAAEMAKWLVDSIMREGKRYQRAQDAGNATYRSFALGAAARIHARVTEIRATAEASSEALASAAGAPGTAIVLRSVYETEQAANKALVEQRYPTRRSGKRGKGATDYEATLEGDRYGRTVSLDRQVGSSKHA